MRKIQPCIHSEIGSLEAVILHTPGPEVENMTPENAERALYSDILNLAVARDEYAQFRNIMSKLTHVYEVSVLFNEILSNADVREILWDRLRGTGITGEVLDRLKDLSADTLTHLLIEGVPKGQETLTDFMNKERFDMRPLHNFFFTRDSSVVIGNEIYISRMAKSVRARETLIMDLIFKHHPSFARHTVTPDDSLPGLQNLKYEGGDILIAREDILVVGQGVRTSSEGIDFLVSHFKKGKSKKHILVQELPETPESFIHLDMVFTFLDRDKCMIFEPLLFKDTKYRTVQIDLDNGKVQSINYVNDLLVGLKNLGMDLEPVLCGGKKDLWTQEREQWHSGANFFAFEPGKILGYSRNVHTIEELNNKGFEVLKASDVIHGKVSPNSYKTVVITLDGSELARGGGGARCMTMPLVREEI